MYETAYWSRLLKKSFMENSIFCAVTDISLFQKEIQKYCQFFHVQYTRHIFIPLRFIQYKAEQPLKKTKTENIKKID